MLVNGVQYVSVVGVECIRIGVQAEQLSCNLWTCMSIFADLYGWIVGGTCVVEWGGMLVLVRDKEWRIDVVTTLHEDAKERHYSLKLFRMKVRCSFC